MAVSSLNFLNISIAGLITFYSCGNTSFLGQSDKDASSSEKNEKVVDQPVEVSGGFGLTCEQVAPSTGEGTWIVKTSQVGCNAVTDKDVILPADANVNLVAVLNTAAASEEKPLDVKKSPHVIFDVKNIEFEQASFSLKGLSIPPGTIKSSKAIIFCGEAGNSCYDNQYAMKQKEAKFATGKPDAYLDLIDGHSGCSTDSCKIWIHRFPDIKLDGGRAVINAAGLAKSHKNWQTTVKEDGLTLGPILAWFENSGGSPSIQSVTPVSGGYKKGPILEIGGRACPRYAMKDDPANPVSGLCLYYDLGTTDQGRGNGLSVPTGGTPWIDGLEAWKLSLGGPGLVWYAGNHKVCKDKGMRLPALYEADVTDRNNEDSKFPPLSSIDMACLFSADTSTTCKGGFSGIPGAGSSTDYTWTATARANTSAQPNSDHYFLWGDKVLHDRFNNTGTNDKHIRCVLPSSDAF